MLYAGRIKFFVVASELVTDAVFQLFVVAKRHLQSASFSGSKMWKSEGSKSGLHGGWGRTVCPIGAISYFVRWEVYGLAMSCIRTTWFIFLFGRTHKIRCFNVFYVCPYRSELIVELLRIRLTGFLHCTVPEAVADRPLGGFWPMSYSPLQYDGLNVQVS
jgi:hypothetical protein